MADIADIKSRVSGIADLSDGDLEALEQEIIDAFDTADAEGASEDDLNTLAESLDAVRTERDKRSGGDSGASGDKPVTAAAETEDEDTTEGDQPTENEDPEDGSEGDNKDIEEGQAVVEVKDIKVPEGRAPIEASAQTAVIAAADIPGVSAGMEFRDSKHFAEALAKRISTMKRISGGDGEQVLVASIKSEVPEDRVLRHGEIEANRSKIEAITDVDAIVAAGGCCAPLTTNYDLFDIGGSSARPVRDALAGFQADRGGIRYFLPPALSDVAGSIGFWTCEDDANALNNTGAPSDVVKACARVECPPEQTAEVQAVTMCLTFGVMQSRVFPELAASNTALAMVAQARLAESALLAQIKAGSTKIADSGSPFGAVRDVLSALARASMYYRDRYRLDQNAPLRAVLPHWLLEVLSTDVIYGPPSTANIQDNFGISVDEVENFFTEKNIRVTWALDSSTPGTRGGGFFDKVAASGGTLPAFPSSVEWGLFPEGSWLYLDGGTLDLGLVRDSSLIRVNDYQQFAETFEAAANIGGESLWITSALDVSGQYAGGIPGTAAVTP